MKRQTESDINKIKHCEHDTAKAALKGFSVTADFSLIYAGTETQNDQMQLVIAKHSVSGDISANINSE